MSGRPRLRQALREAQIDKAVLRAMVPLITYYAGAVSFRDVAQEFYEMVAHSHPLYSKHDVRRCWRKLHRA